MARNLTTDVGERVGAIEGEVGEVRRRVEGTAENVARTDDVLNETDMTCKFARHNHEPGKLVCFYMMKMKVTSEQSGMCLTCLLAYSTSMYSIVSNLLV